MRAPRSQYNPQEPRFDRWSRVTLFACDTLYLGLPLDRHSVLPNILRQPSEGRNPDGWGWTWYLSHKGRTNLLRGDSAVHSADENGIIDHQTEWFARIDNQGHMIR